MAHKVWRVYFKDGAFVMVRKAGRDVSFRECLDILDWRGYTLDDLESMDEEWELDY